MIMPGQHSTQVRANPFGSLHVPATERAYTALSRQQRAALQAALRSVDCAHPPTLSGTAAQVVCDAQSDVYLLGAAIFTGNDVKDAMATPGTNGDPQWSLQLSLNATAADRMYKWTSRYNVQSASGVYNDVQTSAKAPCGASTRTPCADFLAYVSHDKVVTVPVTFEPTQSVVKVLGDFDEASASRLARNIVG
jgi:preprotein translocase subunit SecD